MDLVLWRHCEAAPGVPDDARPLTPRGVAQAKAMATWLAQRLPRNCRILVSPALRAQQTARAFGHDFETTADVGTATTAPALLTAVGWPDAGEDVLVVGHQPTLGEVASLLLEGDAAGRSVGTGAVLWLSSARDGGAVLRIAIAPDRG
ncbi:MAG TPA: histidine phosphatase family protein [Casimicrobiaceae bacterium]